MTTYSIPMELHVSANSPEDALAIAAWMPGHVADNDTGTLHTLLVATDDVDDLDVADD